MSSIIGSEIEKTNLEVHVDMSRQRHQLISEKVANIDDRLDKLTTELAEFRKEHAQAMNDLKQAHLESIAAMREEQAENNNSTVKVVVGAAATIGGGLLSVIVAILIAFL